MFPKTVSASALQNFVCPAGYNAMNIGRAATVDNAPAILGTTCHAVLEWWVLMEHHLKNERFSVMEAQYAQEYWARFEDADLYEDGVKMLETWYNRQDWTDRKVLSCEKKLQFGIPVPKDCDLVWPEDFEETDIVKPGQPVTHIPLSYIMDRMDLRDDGALEVVDYKTIRRPVTPDELKRKIQARVYGLAAQIQYPEATEIWVSFDLLRYDIVGVMFTREDNVATWKHLKSLVARILASDGTEEILNPGCQYCIRKSVCETLLGHEAAGGVAGLDDPYVIADRLAKIKYAMKALKQAEDELMPKMTEYLEENDMVEFESDETVLKLRRRQTRKIDPVFARRILGDEIMARHGTITMGVIDKLLKGTELTDEQKSGLKTSVRKEYGNAWIDYDLKSTED